MKRTMQAINAALLDTLAACGDVNRNVLAAGNPFLSKVHAAAHKLAVDVSQHLLPQTGAYHEIWLDGEQVMDQSGPAKKEEEPIYGAHYLPRKFKIVIAVPPSNDVDIFAHDLGYIAIVENGKLIGYNVTIGGGMGMTHGEPDTFPRTADILGFCTPEQAIDVAEKVLTVQRDWGNRTSRKRARLKYTVEDRGLDAYRDEVEKRLGYKLGEPRPYEFTSTGDVIGWAQGADKKWHLTLFVENGRIKDIPGWSLRTALREIAELHPGGFVYRQSERHHRQRVGEGESKDRGDPQGARHRHRHGTVGHPPQQHGLRRAADVRAGAGRKRALPAGAADGAGRVARQGGPERRRDRHPHDRLP